MLAGSWCSPRFFGSLRRKDVNSSGFDRISEAVWVFVFLSEQFFIIVSYLYVHLFMCFESPHVWVLIDCVLVAVYLFSVCLVWWRSPVSVASVEFSSISHLIYLNLCNRIEGLTIYLTYVFKGLAFLVLAVSLIYLIYVFKGLAFLILGWILFWLVLFPSICRLWTWSRFLNFHFSELVVRPKAENITRQVPITEPCSGVVVLLWVFKCCSKSLDLCIFMSCLSQNTW